MADHDVIGDPDLYRKTAKSQRDLEETVAAFREYKKLAADLEQADEDEKDPELQAMAAERSPRWSRPSPSSSTGCGSCFCPRIPTTRRTSCWRSGPARAATRPACLPPRFSGVAPALRQGLRWKVEVTSVSESGAGGSEGSDRPHQRRQGLLQAQVRERRAPRPARSRDGAARPHSHLHHYRGCSARGG